MHKYYPISIRVELQPNSYSAKFGWEIREMPVLWGYSDEDYCTKSVYQSKMLHNLTERHGKLESRALYNDEFISVMSFTDSIVGSSLVIIDPETGPISCSTILPLSPPTAIFKAEFKSKVGGYVYFLPYFDTSFKKTLIIGTLYKTDGISTIKAYDWYIGKAIRTPYEFGCGDQSKAIFDLLKPQNESCSDGEKKCVIGDLSLKHSRITVGVAVDWSTSRPFAFKDPNLPLDGWNSIAWRTLYLVDPFNRETFSCAVDEIKYRVELRKSLSFKANEILGVVYFKQSSPYHSTYAKIRIQQDKNMKLDKENPPTFVIYDLFPIGVDCNAIGNILMDNQKRPRILLSPKVFEGKLWCHRLQ
ncbi:hypothetical protein RF11_13320 [Thelohanellus kitauei]|uniref:Uncharacterized protein n=1 Tax=Thelohanellus kitauei TaxID=669202 RepID=A0A0C2JY29_THEKT|nr:hypothetical protein RF11_13320 [Thelohanellus kitauei]